MECVNYFALIPKTIFVTLGSMDNVLCTVLFRVVFPTFWLSMNSCVFDLVKRIETD